MEWLTGLLVATGLLLLFLWTRRPKNFPPGPLSLPVVGSLPALALEPAASRHEGLWSLGRRHGPVMGLFLGSKPAVHVSGYEAVRHVLSAEDLAFRPDVELKTHHFQGEKLGLIFTDGSHWQEQRRFTLRHLRDFGFGKQSMEGLIHEEARALLAEVDAIISRGVSEEGADLLPLLPVVAINVLWTIMAGRRHEFTDLNFNKLTTAVMDFFRNGNPFDPVLAFPVLRKVPGLNAAYNRMTEATRQVQTFIEATVEEHLDTLDEHHKRDYIDVYLTEMLAKSGTNTSFSKSQLISGCIDLFIAGTETTSGTLSYALRYLIQHPAVQAKLRQELRQLLGPERLPAMEDMNKCHYMQAVLAEVFRHSGLVAITPPHSCSQDIEVLGYQIPKRSFIMVNLWSVHMDPDIWGDPENFRPERFIAEDGTFHKDEHLLTFGLGPRKCLGEPLARYSTFLFLAALVQRFEFSAPSRGPPLCSDHMPGLTTAPVPFRMRVARV